MFSKEMFELGSKSSIIREIFEFGKKRKAIIGENKVFDFSIGNPAVPAPKSVKNAIEKFLKEPSDFVHGYTSAQGIVETREAIANNLNQRYNTKISFSNIYMTSGAAAALSICFKALYVKNDEFIILAPFFPEYKCFIESTGGKCVIVPPDYEEFQINFEELENAINENTKAIVVNSPNNPTGVIYSETTIKKLASILKEKSQKYKHPIFIISDEPYREIVYNNAIVPFIPKYYENTFICYSYSKTLSLPGERIGYIIVPDEMIESEKVFATICGAGRALGYVCAPSLFQHVVRECVGETSDISKYEENRDLLYNNLKKFGYHCIKPEGAFYLFVKAPNNDALEFCENAKKFDLLIAPGNDFGCPEYMRIAYCVDKDTIRNALPIFNILINN